MKKILLFILLFASLGHLSAQAPLFKNDLAFKSGERAHYNIYYNLGFVWIHAGDVVFSVSETKQNGKPAYLLKLTGYTMKSFDNLFKIRDTFSVVVDKEKMFPYYYREVKHEDTYFCDRQYRFDYKEETPMVHFNFNRKGKITVDSLAIEESVFDLLTTCYRFRSLNVAAVKKGYTVPCRMLFDKTVYDLGLTYQGTEEIKLRNKSKYKALKFTPKLITGDLFKKDDDMKMYVSDDDNHVPLYIEAKIKVGAVKVMLDHVENTKYPLSSQLKSK